MAKTECPQGHRYDSERRWCPKCGAINPITKLRTRPQKAATGIATMIFLIPIPLRAQFKAACRKNGVAMVVEIKKFMEQYGQA